jgi:hypothetical protein
MQAAATSRAAASLQPLRLQMMSSAGYAVHNSQREALIHEELQQYAAADHHMQQPGSAAAGGSYDSSDGVTAPEDQGADDAYDDAVQYIAAVTGLQPAHRPHMADPQPFGASEQGQVISDSSSSLAAP